MTPTALLRLAPAGLLTLVAVLGAPAVHAELAGRVRTRSFRLLNEGVAAYKQGDYPLAVEKLSETASMALNSFRAHYFLGMAQIGNREYRAAIESLNITLDLDPTHMQSLVGLGDAYLKLGDPNEAAAAYVRALKIRPGYAPAQDGIARTFEARARDKEAIDHYRKAIAGDRGYAPAYTHLGDLYLRREQFQDAVRLLEEAVTIRPDYAPGMNRLAVAYGRLGMSGEAVATIRTAIELEPKNADHLVTLGFLELDQSLINRADRSFKAAMALQPEMPEIRLGLAEVDRRRGLYARALSQIDGALALQRLDERTKLRLQEFRESVVREQVRIGGLQVRVAGQDATPDDLEELAQIYAGRGQWGNAAEIQSWGANTPERRERLAYMMFRAGRYRDAHELYAELAEAGGEAPRFNAGVTLAKLGDDLAALDAFEGILQANPDHRLARLYLGNALLRLGRQAGAAEHYRVYLAQDHRGEDAERVRRILKQIAPGTLPPESRSPVPEDPPPPPAETEDAS